MILHGYEIGDKPTSEEWATYYKVKRFEQSETAAQYLHDCNRHARPVSQRSFERFVESFAELEWCMGEEECENLDIAWDTCFSSDFPQNE